MSEVKDCRGIPLEVGQLVALTVPSYRGLTTGLIERITPRQVVVTIAVTPAFSRQVHRDHSYVAVIGA